MSWLRKNFIWLAWPLIALGYYWFYIRATHQIQARGKYTIGYLTGLRPGGKAMDAVAYYCRIHNVRYTGTGPMTQGMNTDDGSRYLVEFDSLDVSQRLLYTDYPLADSVPAPPPGGWNKRWFDARYTFNESRLTEQQRDSLQLVRWQQAHPRPGQ